MSFEVVGDLTGRELYYDEGNDCFKVKVIEDNRDDEWIRFKLLILETITGSHDDKYGGIFTCSSKRGCQGYVGWWLRETPGRGSGDPLWL